MLILDQRQQLVEPPAWARPSPVREAMGQRLPLPVGMIASVSRQSQHRFHDLRLTRA
jgi:hypothetical protein